MILNGVLFFGVKSGFNVYFLTEEENYKRMSSECKIRFKESNINILPPIGYFSIKNPISSLISIVKLNSYLKEYQINIFHVLFGSPQPIWFLFAPNKVKNIVTTRGSDVLVLLKQVMNEGGIKNRILKRLLIAGLCKADYISATSSQQIEFLIECGVAKDKIKLIKTGVDIDRVQIQSKNDSLSTKKEKFIFSARYIGNIYNMDYQIEAIKNLSKETLNNYSFLFSKSRGDNSSFFHKTIAKLESIEGLEYDLCEGATQNKMWATLKASSLVYMVPKSDGTPNTALECMAGRVPLIMGNLDYNKELFSNVCISVDLQDPKDFARKLEEGLKNYPRELLDKAEIIVQKFGNREVEMNKLLDLYLSLNV
jgi:hypothetical protein